MSQPQASNRYEAILFDFDGVLADTEPLHWEAWRDAVKPLGIELSWEFYCSHLIGVSDADLVPLLARLIDPAVDPETIWQRFENKQRFFLAKALAEPPVNEATRNALKMLEGYKLAIVTSTSITEIDPLLHAAGIRDRFQTIVAAEDVQRHKPDPEPYLLAARRLGVTRALVVEDSDAGEAAGRAAGFDVLRVRSASEVAESLIRCLGRKS